MSSEFTGEEVRSLILNLALMTSHVERLYEIGDASAKYLSILTNRIVEIGKEKDTDAVDSSYKKCRKLMEKFDSISKSAVKMFKQLDDLVDSLDRLLDEQSDGTVDK